MEKFLRRHITIPLWNRRSNMNYRNELRDIVAIHSYSLEQLRQYQLSRLRKLLHFAYEKVPYYRNEWTKIGLNPEDIKTFADFQSIPVLTKESLRANADDLLSHVTSRKNLIKSGTGGTTDSPILLYYDHARARMKEAEMHYFRKWFRWELGDKVAYLWGAPQDIPNIDNLRYKIINRLTQNKLFLFSSMMTPSIMDAFIDKLNRYKPDILQAYPNPAYILAKYISKTGAAVWAPKSVVLTAEPCLQHQRKAIEEAFQSEIFTFYGCREGGYVGCECDQHTGYHINCTSLYMEFLSENGPVGPDQLGNIVFTDLYNFDMPFIRYQIGDLGIPSENGCPCGSPLPMMRFFAGRETDVFVTPDGGFVPGVSLCDRIIEDCRGIEQLQFVQNKVDELVVKIVKGRDYSASDMAQLDSRLDNYFHGKLTIVKDFVDDIPKEKSGKTRFCISNVDKNI